MTDRASNYTDLYNFEDTIEAAVGAELEDRGMGTVLLVRATDTRSNPRIEVDCQVGANLNIGGLRSSDNEPYSRAWAGRLLVSYVSRRGDATQRAAHGTNVSLIRWTMQDLDALNARLTYHAFARILETGTTRTTIPDADEDVSTISFEWQFEILPDAWPMDVLRAHTGEMITTEDGTPIYLGGT